VGNAPQNRIDRFAHYRDRFIRLSLMALAAAILGASAVLVGTITLIYVWGYLDKLITDLLGG
jgi:hypothetical protein